MEELIRENKPRKSNKILIILLVMVLLFFTSISIYYFFIYKKDNINDNNDNNIQENQNNNNISDNNDNNIQENQNNNNISDKVLDEYYLKTIDIIDEHILEYRYSEIANNKISYEEFRKNYVVKNIIDNLDLISNVGCGDENTVNHEKDIYDKNGVKYPDYSAPENIAKDFGLTVDEINKMDKNIWSVGGGQYCIYMYDAKEIKNKYINIYNDMFNSSFSLHLINKDDSADFYSFDKNLDKVIVKSHGGTRAYYDSVIIDSKMENNLYKVRFVEGYFDYNNDLSSNSKYILFVDSENNNKIANTSDKSSALKENKDKLPNYEITFKKTEEGYKFDNVKRIKAGVNNNQGTEKDYMIDLSKIECVKGNNSCTKELKVTYDGKEHDLKLVMSKQNVDTSAISCDFNNNMNLYIDGKLIDTYNNGCNGKLDFNGHIYIFDSRYLGIMYPRNHIGSEGYYLILYKNNAAIASQTIKTTGQSICRDEKCNEPLNTLDKIEFDGSNLKFWTTGCSVNIDGLYLNAIGKVVLNIKDEKINLEVIEKIKAEEGHVRGAVC